jgi:hypothetical protein
MEIIQTTLSLSSTSIPNAPTPANACQRPPHPHHPDFPKPHCCHHNMDLPNLAPTSRTNTTSHNTDHNLQDSKCLYKQLPCTIPQRPALHAHLSLLDCPQHQDFHAMHWREGKWVRICAVSILFYFLAIVFTSVHDFYTVNPFRLPLSINKTHEFFHPSICILINCPPWPPMPARPPHEHTPHVN